MTRNGIVKNGDPSGTVNGRRWQRQSFKHRTYVVDVDVVIEFWLMGDHRLVVGLISLDSHDDRLKMLRKLHCTLSSGVAI